VQETSPATAPSEPLSTQGTETRFLFLLTLCIVLAAGLLFFTNNRFSVKCHIDEPSKVAQIQSRERNFHHPLLMLNTTQVAFALSGLEPTPQAIARVGRTCSAVFSTLAILALAYGALLVAGRVAAILCAVFLLASPLFIELSHFFKEDPAFMMGIAFAFLSMIVYQRTPGMGQLLFLAIGAALACSGKHIGILLVPFCVFTILKSGGVDAKRHLRFFFSVTLLGYTLINYQLLTHLTDFIGAIDQETYYLKKGGYQVTEPRPGLHSLQKYIEVLVKNISLPFLWFTGFCVYSWAKRWERAPIGRMLLFVGILFVGLALTPKTAARYLMPVVGLLAFTSAIGAARIFAKPGWKWKIAGFALPLALALVDLGKDGLRAFDSFGDDSRVKMAQWVATNLPKDSLIAQDTKGLLTNTLASTPDDPYQVPQRILNAGELIHLRSIDVLQANGVQYLVVLSDDFRPAAMKKRDHSADCDADDSFTRELKTKCHKVWAYGDNSRRTRAISPSLEIYELPGA